VKKKALEKMNQSKKENEATDSAASEGKCVTSVSTRTGEDEHLRIPWFHDFTVSYLLSECTAQRKRANLLHFSLDLTVMVNS